MSISVILCTKDRPDDLSRCLDSIQKQSVKPDELIVVDASSGNETERLCYNRRGTSSIELKYIRSKPHLTHQRNLGVDSSGGELIFFFDDDVILDERYLENVREAFLRYGPGGVSGTCEDVFKLPMLKKCFLKMFMLTRFDGASSRIQPSAFPVWALKPPSRINVECLQGLCMSYRREVFDEFRFDEEIPRRGGLEDVDFSYRVSRKYKLLQIPGAKVFHKRSLKSRTPDGEHFFTKMVYHYRFFGKNVNKSFLNWTCFWWSNAGELLKSIFYSVRSKTPSPVIGVCRGLHCVFKELLRR